MQHMRRHKSLQHTHSSLLGAANTMPNLLSPQGDLLSELPVAFEVHVDLIVIRICIDWLFGVESEFCDSN